MKTLTLFFLLIPLFASSQTSGTIIHSAGHIGIGDGGSPPTELHVYGPDCPDTLGLYNSSMYFKESAKLDTVPHYSTVRKSNLSVGSGTLGPAHLITIAGNGKTRLNIDFKGDSMVVTGDMKMTEGAKKFIDYCRQYFRTKIDSLQFKIDSLELKILNDPWNVKNPKYQAR